MKIKALGNGDCFTKKNNNNTCFILEADKKYLIDFPKEFFNRLNPKKINDIFITHLHQDHINNLESFLFYKRKIEKKKVNIYASKKVFQMLEKKLSITMCPRINEHKRTEESFNNYLNFIELKTGEKNKVNNLEVEIRDNWHQISTNALKIKYNNKTIGYSSDTKYSPNYSKKLLEKGTISKEKKEKLDGFLWDSDLIIHEATNVENEIHTNVSELEKLSKKIQKKLILAHIPDNLKTNLKIMKKNKLYLV